MDMTTTTTKLPSLAQMVSRSNGGHLHVLQAAAANAAIADSRTSVSAIRGYRVCDATLDRWGCTTTALEGEVRERIGPDAWSVKQKGTYVTRLTDRGVDLLAALEARQTRATGKES